MQSQPVSANALPLFREKSDSSSQHCMTPNCLFTVCYSPGLMQVCAPSVIIKSFRVSCLSATLAQTEECHDNSQQIFNVCCKVESAFFLLMGASPTFKYDTKDLFFFFPLGCRREENPSNNTHILIGFINFNYLLLLLNESICTGVDKCNMHICCDIFFIIIINGAHTLCKQTQEPSKAFPVKDRKAQ